MKRSIKLTITKSRRTTYIESGSVDRSSEQPSRAESEDPPLKAIDQHVPADIFEIDPIVSGHHIDAIKQESHD